MRDKTPVLHKRGAGNRIFKDPDIRREFFRVLGIGGSIRDACYSCRIALSAYKNECIRSKKFRRRCDRYQIDAKLHHIQRVYDAENKWQASAWFLERRYREEYAVNLPEGTGDEVRAIKVRRIVRSQSPTIREPSISIKDRRHGPKKPAAATSSNDN